MVVSAIIAHLIWKGSYNAKIGVGPGRVIIAHLIWKGSYNHKLAGYNSEQL